MQTHTLLNVELKKKLKQFCRTYLFKIFMFPTDPNYSVMAAYKSEKK